MQKKFPVHYNFFSCGVKFIVCLWTLPVHFSPRCVGRTQDRSHTRVSNDVRHITPQQVKERWTVIYQEKEKNRAGPKLLHALSRKDATKRFQKPPPTLGDCSWLNYFSLLFLPLPLFLEEVNFNVLFFKSFDPYYRVFGGFLHIDWMWLRSLHLPPPHPAFYKSNQSRGCTRNHILTPKTVWTDFISLYFCLPLPQNCV